MRERGKAVSRTPYTTQAAPVRLGVVRSATAGLVWFACGSSIRVAPPALPASRYCA